MTTYSIIQRSQLEGAHRMDAEYYQPEYLLLSDKLAKHPVYPLEEVTNKVDVGFVSLMKNQFKESGVPLLRTQNVKEFYVDLDSNVVFIDKAFHNKLKKSQLHPGYVLLARSGSIGLSCMVPDDLPVANSSDIILIEPGSKIKPEFLTTFINSKYGQFQIERGSSGALQGHINLFSLEKMNVPMVPINIQDKICSIVKSALHCLDESKSLYCKAENMLLEELGLNDFEEKEDSSCVVKLSDIKSAHRMDSDHFQPKYSKLIKALGENINSLGKITKRKPAPAKIILDRDYNYTEISDVNAGNGEITYNLIKGKELPANAKILVNGGELIISKVRPTRGAIAIIPDDWNVNHIVSGAFSVFDVESPMREYLQVVLKSIIGKIQLEKPTTGTSYPTVTDEDIENIFIPILPKATQQKIADLVRKSHEARKKAKELLEEAKRKVEEMIEKEATI